MFHPYASLLTEIVHISYVSWSLCKISDSHHPVIQRFSVCTPFPPDPCSHLGLRSSQVCASFRCLFFFKNASCFRSLCETVGVKLTLNSGRQVSKHTAKKKTPQTNANPSCSQPSVSLFCSKVWLYRQACCLEQQQVDTHDIHKINEICLSVDKYVYIYNIIIYAYTYMSKHTYINIMQITYIYI